MSTPEHESDIEVPPIRNRSVGGSPPRRNFYLPYILAAVGLMLVILVIRSWQPRDAAPLGPQAVPTPAAPG